MKSEFDIIVVGAGINGLTAGAYLAKSGLEVAVVERRNECGPFCMAEDIFGVGLPVGTCAVQCVTGTRPVRQHLDIDSFGFEYIETDPYHCVTWKDGKNIAIYLDYRKTAKELERFSKKDGETYLRIMEKYVPDLGKIWPPLMFSPASKEKMHLWWDLGKYAGFSPDDMRSMNGFELLDLLFEDEHSKMAFLAFSDVKFVGPPEEKGWGAVNTFAWMYFPYGLCKGGMHNLPHALVRCFRHHGGTLFLNAPVEKVSYEGGVAKSVVLSDEAPFPERELKARHAVIMHVTPQVALPILGEETLKQVSPDLTLKMQQWIMSDYCPYNSFWLIKRPTPWKSAAWNPDIMKSAINFRAWDSWEQAHLSSSYYASENVWKIIGDMGEVFCEAAGDPIHFSPEGYCVQTFEVEYPPWLRRYGGLKQWNDRKFTDEIHRQHTEIMEELAPGFKELIIDSKYMSPMDYWRKNASAVLGHETGGGVHRTQGYLGRMPVRAPIPNLYFCQSTWPHGHSGLYVGHNTATVVAEDLGVRKQPWWVTPGGD